MSAKRKKLSVDELTRLAFVCAERDRVSLADAWPEGTDEREQAEWQYAQIRAYRLKRWGRTRGEQELDAVRPVTLAELCKPDTREEGRE